MACTPCIDIMSIYCPRFTALRLGLLVAIQYILRCKIGALLFSGLPCSAHVWMSSGTTKKTRQNPRGDINEPSTAAGNCLAARFGLVVLLAICRQVFWLCEQPSSSVAPYLPYLDWVMNINRVMSGLPAGSVVRLLLDCSMVAMC